MEQIISQDSQKLQETGAVLAELYGHKSFGAWQPIVQNINRLYLEGLTELTAELPSAAPLLKKLEILSPAKRYLVVGDPVLRVLLHRALNLKAEMGGLSGWEAWDEAELACSNILAYLEQAENCLDQTLLQIFGTGPDRQHYLGAAPFQVVLWQPQVIATEFPLASEFETLFRREIAPGFASKMVRLRPPAGCGRTNLTYGLKILQRLWPDMLVETIAHVKVIGLVDREAEKGHLEEGDVEMSFSGSNYAVPGSIFLSPMAAGHPLRAAQAIFHETTHQKAANLVTTLSLLNDNYRFANIAPIEPNWHSKKMAWPVDRSLFALHYYVHSIPFYLLLAEHWSSLVRDYGGPAGQEPPELLARYGMERAAFLHDQIMLRAADFLEPEGFEFMGWLHHQIDLFGYLVQ